MQPVSKLVSVFLLLSCILAACGPVTAVPIATSTGLPAIPTLPPVTATASPSFLSGSEGPSKDVSSYRLRPWTEHDYTQIITTLENLLGNNANPIPYEILPDYLVAFQSEYLLRFPNSSSRNDVPWEILLNDPRTVAVPGLTYGDDLMSVLISELLTNHPQPTELSSELEKHHFQVLNTLTLQNLVGNGEEGTVLLLRMIGFEHLVGAFAIYRDGEGFRVRKIRDWEAAEAPALGRNFEIHNMGDTNNNSFPEIVVEVEAGSSDIGKKTIDHIEWSPEKKIFQSQTFPVFWQACGVFDDGECQGDWTFHNLGTKSTLVTKSHWKSRENCSDVIIEHTFVWDGDQYTFENREIAPPEEDTSPECRLAWAETAIWLPSVGWANDLLALGWENDLAISIMENGLSNWPEHADEIWGPAGRDHFRLQLGIWYELRNEPEKAKAILEQVVNHPYDIEHDFVSRLASHYIEQRERFGKVNACRDLTDTYFDEFQLAIPDPSPFNNDQAMIEEWGIVDAKGLYCDDYDMLSADVKYIHAQSQQSLEKWLESNEFMIYQVVPKDLNNDALEDYVILLDAMDTTYDAWIFLATPRGYESKFMYNMWPDDDQSKLIVHSIDVESGEPLHMVMLDEDLVVFRVKPDLSMETLLEEYGVQSIATNQIPASLILEIENDFDGRKTIPYLWDPELQTFVEQADTFASAESAVEKSLYVEMDYRDTIHYIDDFLHTALPEPRRAYACGGDIPAGCLYLPEWYGPYFRYLQGVAYEQLGQMEQAKQAYYELWKDFPENVFGLAASWKLEPINP